MGRERESRLRVRVVPPRGAANGEDADDGEDSAGPRRRPRRRASLPPGAAVDVADERDEELERLQKAGREIVAKLARADKYAFFLEPVPTDIITDYLEFIKHPMDLGTVRQNIDDGKYASAGELRADIELIWDNCCTYNAKDTVYYKAAVKLRAMSATMFDRLQARLEAATEPTVEPTSPSTSDRAASPVTTRKRPRARSASMSSTQRAGRSPHQAKRGRRRSTASATREARPRRASARAAARDETESAETAEEEVSAVADADDADELNDEEEDGPRASNEPRDDVVEEEPTGNADGGGDTGDAGEASAAEDEGGRASDEAVGDEAAAEGEAIRGPPPAVAARATVSPQSRPAPDGYQPALDTPQWDSLAAEQGNHSATALDRTYRAKEHPYARKFDEVVVASAPEAHGLLARLLSGDGATVLEVSDLLLERVLRPELRDAVWQMSDVDLPRQNEAFEAVQGCSTSGSVDWTSVQMLRKGIADVYRKHGPREKPMSTSDIDLMLRENFSNILHLHRQRAETASSGGSGRTPSRDEEDALLRKIMHGTADVVAKLLPSDVVEPEGVAMAAEALARTRRKSGPDSKQLN